MKDLTDNIPALMAELGARAQAASAELAFASAEAKQQALEAAAQAVWTDRAAIIAANDKHFLSNQLSAVTKSFSMNSPF